MRSLVQPSSDDEADEFADFFDDRSLLRRPRFSRAGASLPRPRLLPALERRAWSNLDSSIAAVLVAASAVCIVLMRATSAGIQSEIFESPWFVRLWAITPSLVVIASVCRPFRGRPIRWAAAVIGPCVLLAWAEGWIWFDASRGASFWALTAMYLFAMAIVSLAAGLLAAHVRRAVS
jgi:hypothetical protein